MHRARHTSQLGLREFSSAPQLGAEREDAARPKASRMEPVEIYYPGGVGRSAVSVQRVSGGLYSHFYEDEVREPQVHDCYSSGGMSRHCLAAGRWRNALTRCLAAGQ